MKKDLEKLIRTLAKSVEQIYDPFSLGVRFPIEGESLRIMRERLEEMLEPMKKQSFLLLPQEFTVMRKRFAEYFSTDKSLAIAGQVFSHDIKNDWYGLASLAVHSSPKAQARRRSPEFLEEFAYTMFQVKVFSSVVSRIATHGSIKNITYVPIDQLKYVLAAKFERPIHVTISNLPAEALIRSDMYICLQELVKNAIFFSYAGTPPEVSVHVYDTESQSGQHYRVIRVDDAGRGIMGFDGKPLPKEKIAALYSEYSSSGGGVGGQIIGELIDLANSERTPSQLESGRYNINLTTKVHGHDLAHFNRAESLYVYGLEEIKRIQISPYSLPIHLPSVNHGTSFSLNIPMEE